MNFDFGEVLTRAWKITWKSKALWIVGVLFGVSVSAMFPFMFFPMLFPIWMQNSTLDGRSASVFMIGFLGLFLLFLAALYPISVFAQSSLTLGVLQAEQEDGAHLSAMDLLKKSRPFFWRVLGLMLLFVLGIGLINLVIQALIFVSVILTMGIATVCMAPLMLLMYPVIYGAMVWMEQAMNSILIDDMRVIEAAKHGWKLVRSNLMPMVVMALVVYLGVGFVTGILMVPMFFPLFIVPFGIAGNQIDWTILWIAGLWILAFIPLFAVVTGLSLIFTKSAWVLTYLRLRRSLDVKPLPGIVEAPA